MKNLRYLIEGVLVNLLIGLFRFLPLDVASGIGGFIGRSIGPLLAVNRKALRNIRLSLPGKSDKEYRKIIRDMWDNLGRVFAEYPHLEKIAKTRMISEGEENLSQIIHSNIPCILFTGHLANWETAAAYAYKIGINLDLVFRAPNNPYVDKILQRCRSMDGKLITYPKSSKGMRDIFSALKSGRRVGILIDQKYNQGLPMPFFGRIAMTSPAFAQLAQRFDCPLHPARIERLKGAHFKIMIYPAMNTKDRTVEELITESHIMLEKWITERPGQWLWLHRRWRENNHETDNA